MDEAERVLREWAESVLADAPLSDYWRPLWVKQGKMVCAHCGGPVYKDDGPMGSGYYMHCPILIGDTSRMPDGTNGYHCGPKFEGPTAVPIERGGYDDETIASYVLAVLNR